MFDRLESILAKVDADYADVRYERRTATSVAFNGPELTRIGSSSTDGYVLRVLKQGGLATMAFTRFDDADEAVRKAAEHAALLARHAPEPVRLAEVEVVQETYAPELDIDPRTVPIEEKLELTRRYNAIALGFDKVVTTVTGYADIVREKHFASTEGARIREDLVTTRTGGGITAKEGALIQTVRVSLGGSHGFATVTGCEEAFEHKARIATELLAAEPVRGGSYSVVLNPLLAGVFTHEAFGHFSEADLLEDAPTMRERMQLGAKLGSDAVSIRDDPTLTGRLGHYAFDDEGVRARPTQLMKEGVLTGRLHSRRTAAAFGEPPSGHAVAEDCRYAPIVRMGTIFIEAGGTSFDGLLERMGDGLYLLDNKGGQTAGESFTFGAQYGYLVKGGKLDRMVRDINITGNLYETLQNIECVGDEVAYSRTGGCGKGQINLRSCYGAPHILVRNVIVGGV